MKNGGGNRSMARKIPFVGKKTIQISYPWMKKGQFDDVCAYFEPVHEDAELKGEPTSYRAFIRVMDESLYWHLCYVRYSFQHC